MGVNGMYLLGAGLLEVDKGILTYRVDMGKKTRIPVMMVLLRTDDGDILFDTGLNPHGLKDPLNTWGERSPAIFKFSPEDDVRNRLKELDLKTDDIKYVVISHFHWDHTGGMQFFTKSKFIVQKAEYRFAYHPDSFLESSRVYLKKDFDHPLDYELIEGDMELVPGVSLVTAYGHTPGHQAMIVSLPDSGTVVLTGDAIYSRENIEKDIPGGNSWNPVQAMESMHRLIHLAKREKGRLIMWHDPDVWSIWKPSPYCYR